LPTADEQTLIGWDIRNHRICHQFVKMQIRGRKPKKQPIRAGGISASPPQATRGCAARCRGFAAFACARETQQYRQLRRLETWSDVCPFKKEKLFAALCY